MSDKQKDKTLSEKTVVFQVLSTWNVFTSALIGELYYGDAKRILFSGFHLDSDYIDRILKSGLFDEVYSFEEKEKSIFNIEQQVNMFLTKCPKIDELFSCASFDRYGDFLIYKLSENIKCCLVQDGAPVNIREDLKLAVQHLSEINNDNKRFFEKYPIKLDSFKEIWAYDEKAPTEMSSIPVKKIEITRLLEDKQYIIEKLNILFDYQKNLIEDCDVVYCDGPLAEFHWIDFQGEKEILKQLFQYFTGKKVVIKPHHGQDKIFEATKFYNFNVSIYPKENTPWELIYLNILKRNRRKKLVLISYLLSTVVWNTVTIADAEHNIDILSLENLEKPYLAEEGSFGGLTRKYRYFLDFVKTNSNVRFFAPPDFEQLRIDCLKIFPNSYLRNEQTTGKNFLASVPFFLRIGNLITKSFLLDKKTNKLIYTYFEFLEKKSELVFFVDGQINSTELVWWPSESNLFAHLVGLKIYAEDRDGNSRLSYICDEKVVLNDEGAVILHVPDCGYCKTIKFVTELKTRKGYSELSKSYDETKWRLEFWEKWNDVKARNMLRYYVERKRLNNIWVIGDGKIGSEIKSQLDQINVNVSFVGTRSKKMPRYKVCSVDELVTRGELPDILIITAMYDYQEILYGLPRCLRERAFSLREFVSDIFSIKDE